MIEGFKIIKKPLSEVEEQCLIDLLSQDINWLLGIYNIPKNMPISFQDADKKEEDSKDSNSFTIDELEKYLKDLLSPDLAEAVIRELKIKKGIK